MLRQLLAVQLHAVLSIFSSASLFLLLSPLLERHRISCTIHFEANKAVATIARPPEAIPWYAPVLVRLIEVVWHSQLSDEGDVIRLAILGRAGWAVLLCTCYKIPFWVTTVCIMCDVFSLYVPHRLLYGAHYKRDSMNPWRIEHFAQTCAGSCALATTFYIAWGYYLSSFIIMHFDDIKSVLQPWPILLAVAFLPISLLVRAHLRTDEILARTAEIIWASLLCSGASIAMTCPASDIWGVLGYVCTWNVCLYASCSVIAYLKA